MRLWKIFIYPMCLFFGAFSALTMHAMHVAIQKPCLAKLTAFITGVKATIINNTSTDITLFFYGATKQAPSTQATSSLTAFRIHLVPGQALALSPLPIGAIDNDNGDSRPYPVIHLETATHFSLHSREAPKIPIVGGSTYVLEDTTERKR